MSKLYVVGRSFGYASWVPSNLVSSPQEADVLLFTGGEDINPSLYGENRGSQTYFSADRCEREVAIFNTFKDTKRFLGICRGAQLLCALSGKKIVQHMIHPGKHTINFLDGTSCVSNSLHHQQMLVDGKYTNNRDDDYELIGWTNRINTVHLNGDDVNYNMSNDYREPEIVWFPNTRALCIQAHPEMMDKKSEFVIKCTHFYEKFLS